MKKNVKKEVLKVWDIKFLDKSKKSKKKSIFQQKRKLV